jgi:C4-dicarboxylate transporter DctQ subunit
MLAAMFVTFLLQIFSRYVLASPFGWTLELCLILWVWIVFFGCAFLVKDVNHVTFDILYLAAPVKIQRFFALVSAFRHFHWHGLGLLAHFGLHRLDENP